LNKWRVVGHIFLVWGSVLLISALGAFIGMISVIDQTLYVDEALISAASAVIAPYLGFAAFAYVISGVGYYAGRENAATPISSNESNVTINAALDKTDNLEENVDNNFNFTVLMKRFEEIEEKQNRKNNERED
jgi:hypothetical protein